MQLQANPTKIKKSLFWRVFILKKWDFKKMIKAYSLDLDDNCSFNKPKCQQTWILLIFSRI